MGNFRVSLKKVVDDSYDIQIGYQLMDQLLEDIQNGLIPGIQKFAVITDSVVAPLYAEPICEKLKAAGYQTDLFVFEAGEKSKVRKTKEVLEDAMLAKGYRRDCCVIAVGGGVVTDLAGFLAGTYGRGVPFINYATTLLAAADASVGGKTAVDTPLATNLIGLFNQPEKVYIDIDTWKTLPRRQIASGLSETIKHACLANAELFEYLEGHIDEVFEGKRQACEYIAEANCRIKYEVIMKDEREKSLREVLNLGHTVGRAIETVSGYRLLHGEALSIGMVAQITMGVSLGFASETDKERVIALYGRAGLPVAVPDYIDREELVKKLYTDKKVKNGTLRFVFQNGIGKVMEFENETYAMPVSEEKAREIIFAMP